MPAQSKSRRLAANACWAACVRMADQRERREASTALRRMLGALAFVWAKRRRKVVASGLHRPPVSRARTTSLHRLERRSSGYVRSLDLRASWSAAPAYWPVLLKLLLRWNFHPTFVATFSPFVADRRATARTTATLSHAASRPKKKLLRIGRHVFWAGWMKSKGIPRWCRPRVALPPIVGGHWL